MGLRQTTNLQPQDLRRRLQQQELDLVRLKRNLELANLELDRARQRQREFLVNTSHELRTPLNAILSFLRLVLDGLCDSPEEVRQFVRTAYDSARSLLDLINEHLDSASLEAGKVDLQLTEVDVATVFDQVEKLATEKADQQKVRLIFRSPRTRLLVRADPVKLPQVLLSLVTNAVKFSIRGEVRVLVRSCRDQGHVQFQVRIMGLELDSENRDRLMHELDAAPDSAHRQQGGNGLGLVSWKTLVECMGGQIWLRPGPGQEASVCFTLPLMTSQPLYWRRTADRDRGLEIQGPAGGPLILLVEDDSRILDKLARILQTQGYRTAFAVTADDGLQGAKRLAPDLITIDLGLPVRLRGVLRSGLDLYQTLQHDPRLAGIPVLLVTGHDPNLLQAPRKLPPILNKPFRAQRLLDLVADELRRESRALRSG
jgi:CheY-like chemotaxis protein